MGTHEGAPWGVLATRVDFTLNPGAVNQFAPRLPGMMTYTNNPRAAIAQAYTALNNLQAQVTHFTDPSFVQNAINQSRAALDQAVHGLDLASDPAGNARPIDGPGGVLDPLSLAEFQQFLSDCAAQGVAASPPAEVAVVDGLMSLLAIAPRGQPSKGPAIASWDGALTAMFTSACPRRPPNVRT